MWNSKSLSAKEVSNLKRLSQTAFDKRGILFSFSKQLKLWKKGKLQRTDHIIVGSETRNNSVPDIENIPLIIRQSVIRKIVIDKHGIPIKCFRNLEKLIEKSPLVVESTQRKNAYLVVLDKKFSKNKYLVCIIESNQIKCGVLVNEINSIHGRNIEVMINKATSSNKRLFTTPKTNKWLYKRGLKIK
jgi:hypothetical protein